MIFIKSYFVFKQLTCNFLISQNQSIQKIKWLTLWKLPRAWKWLKDIFKLYTKSLPFN